MTSSGIQAILDVTLSYISDSRDSIKASINNTNSSFQESFDKSKQTEALSSEEMDTIISTIKDLLFKKINLSEANNVINPIIKTTQPMQKLGAILSVTEDPIPNLTFCTSQGHPNVSRQKSRPWMQYEDQRLLAAILRYGLENWILVSEFVGNGRTRSQCSQRWNRGLNPKISKGTWSKEEEDKLIKLVDESGEKSWTKIAMHFGNRSDVQCRYRYQQLTRSTTEDVETIKNPLSPTLHLLNDENDLGPKPVIIHNSLASRNLETNDQTISNKANSGPKITLPPIDASVFIEC